AVQAAIDDGRLPNVEIASGRALAVAAASEIVLLDGMSLDQLNRVALDAPATGLALNERLNEPMLYVAMGEQIATVQLESDASPMRRGTIEMPGAVWDVYWNPATNLVHALGETPDGSAQTVYVIEPHGNAVFADAQLSTDPVAVVLDVQPQRPSA